MGIQQLDYSLRKVNGFIVMASPKKGKYLLELHADWEASWRDSRELELLGWQSVVHVVAKRSLLSHSCYHSLIVGWEVLVDEKC